MRNLPFRAWITTSIILIVARPAFCQAPPSCNGGPSEKAQISALKKKLAEQDQRISELERQVKDLLGPRKTVEASQPPKPAESAAEKTSPVGASASTAVVSATPEPVAAVSPPVQRPREQTGRSVRSLLSPIHFGGNVYLFQYVPLGIAGARPKFELYAFSALVDGQKGPWGFHADYRFRTTKLRSFFPGNTWLQQGYVRYRTDYGEFNAGSFYRRVGLDWDDSFFGNIEYFDGLMLDPEFGVGFQGSHKISGRLGAEYSLQYFSVSSPINGSLPGRDFVSQPGARAKNDVTSHFAPVWHFNKWASLNVGGSFAQGTIERDAGPHNRRRQVAADATLQLGPVLTYGEVLRQTVNGQVLLPPQNATYTLMGIRWAKGRYQPRINYSQANYHGLNARREYIVQPGINIRVADHLTFIYEYDFWRELSVLKPKTLDRSLNMVLLYHF